MSLADLRFVRLRRSVALHDRGRVRLWCLQAEIRDAGCRVLHIDLLPREHRRAGLPVDLGWRVKFRVAIGHYRALLQFLVEVAEADRRRETMTRPPFTCTYYFIILIFEEEKEKSIKLNKHINYKSDISIYTFNHLRHYN